MGNNQLKYAIDHILEDNEDTVFYIVSVISSFEELKSRAQINEDVKGALRLNYLLRNEGKQIIDDLIRAYGTD
ncbi:hypothetical protein L1987_09698 [Smallanthus sonchifolius]|uniref:Uncharacterized protein n=1 Tax=Smallanthus sonchifolius TaxID=185202 RepID=A0ACB9JQ28_9ASTR|nr:hypothetical protein L1987_09698 [Smallanthus sonchifolius]